MLVYVNVGTRLSVRARVTVEWFSIIKKATLSRNSAKWKRKKKRREAEATRATRKRRKEKEKVINTAFYDEAKPPIFDHLGPFRHGTTTVRKDAAGYCHFFLKRDGKKRSHLHTVKKKGRASHPETMRKKKRERKSHSSFGHILHYSQACHKPGMLLTKARHLVKSTQACTAEQRTTDSRLTSVPQLTICMLAYCACECVCVCVCFFY